jgi:predicted RNase H-like HicB family nuclease
MRSGDILYMVLGTPALVLKSASAHTLLFESSRLDNFTAPVPAAPLAITSTLNRWCRKQSTGLQKSQWLTSGAAVSLAPMHIPIIPEQTDLTTTRTETTPTETVSNTLIETASKRARAERLELAIDSLHNYDLLRPITVLIESLGDKVFVAEAPDLNVSTTGNSVGAAFLLLKEQIIHIYEGLHNKKGPDADRERQLAVFGQYIGNARRRWF